MQVLETQTLYMPDLKCRLFPLQSYMNEKGHHQTKLIIEYKGATFHIAPDKSVFIKYEKQTCLPILPTFSNAMDSAEIVALSGNLLD